MNLLRSSAVVGGVAVLAASCALVAGLDELVPASTTTSGAGGLGGGGHSAAGAQPGGSGGDAGHGGTTYSDGEHVWSFRFGDHTELQAAKAVATDADGNIVVVGDFVAEVDFGDGALDSAGASDIFVVKLAPDGSLIWSKRFGDQGQEHVADVAVDSTGSIVLVGEFSGDIHFGGPTLTSPGVAAAFIAKLAPDGERRWERSFGGSDLNIAEAVALASDDAVLVTGEFTEEVAIAGCLTVSTGGDYDLFVAQLDAGGTCEWLHAFGDDQYQQGTAIAVDSAGDAVVAGYFLGQMNVDGQTLDDDADGGDLFQLKLEPPGDRSWARDYAATWSIPTPRPHVYDVAIDGFDDSVMTGAFQDTIDLGQGPVTSAGGWDGFIARYTAAGAVSWVKPLGDGQDQRGVAVAIGANDHIVHVGNFAGTVDVGGGPLNAVGDSDDIYLVKFDAYGEHLWSQRFGDATQQNAWDVTVDRNDFIIVVGSFRGTVDFGGALLESAGATDIFIAKFAP